MTAEGSTTWKRAALGAWFRSVAVFACLLCLTGAGLAPASPVAAIERAGGQSLGQFQEDEFPRPSPNRERGVYDTVGILTAAEERSIQTDINRASGLGVEMLVYTRMSQQSAADSQVFAERLNAEWAVESSEGANDGLVYLLTVNPLDPGTNSVVVGAGRSALPIRQFDQAALEHVIETEMAPEVGEGNFARAFQFGLRRVLNAVEYSPPEPAPLTSAQQTLHKAATVLGAALIQFAVVGYVAIALVRERRLTLAPGSRTLSIYAVCLGVLSVLVGLVAIVGRNAFGSLTALALLVTAAVVLPLIIGARQRHEAGVKVKRLRVARRPEGRISTIGSANG